MLYDRWRISHISLTVPDLAGAMEHFAASMGVEWSTLFDFDALPAAIFTADGEDISGGLRQVWSKKSGIDGSGPSLELSYSLPGSPSQALFSVPGSVSFVNHLGYWVDDLEAETEALTAQGYTREASATPPGEPVRVFTYCVSPTGLRVELTDAAAQPTIERWLQTGELILPTPPQS